MSLKEFLLDVLCRTVNASWYRTLGCSPEEASFLADMEANTAFFKQSEKRNPSYALSELRCNLSEEDRNTERPETLESICAASGDVDAYIAEKSKTDARYSAVQKEFQRIDASKTPDYMKGQKNSVRKPPGSAKKQERRTVNLSLLRWYAYLSPLRFWAILLPSNLLTSNQKKSDPERPGFFGQGSAAKTGGRSVLPFSAY